MILIEEMQGICMVEIDDADAATTADRNIHQL
jgi:hypothetical protein